MEEGNSGSKSGRRNGGSGRKSGVSVKSGGREKGEKGGKIKRSGLQDI